MVHMSTWALAANRHIMRTSAALEVPPHWKISANSRSRLSTSTRFSDRRVPPPSSLSLIPAGRRTSPLLAPQHLLLPDFLNRDDTTEAGSGLEGASRRVGARHGTRWIRLASSWTAGSGERLWRKIHGAPLSSISASCVASSPPCHTRRAHPRFLFPYPATQIPRLRRQRAPPTSPLPPGAQHACGSSEFQHSIAYSRWFSSLSSVDRVVSYFDHVSPYI